MLLSLIAISTTLIIGCSGCATVTLYPIAKEDIVQMNKGTSYTTDRDGYFLSKVYIDKVLAARVK